MGYQTSVLKVTVSGRLRFTFFQLREETCAAPAQVPRLRRGLQGAAPPHQAHDRTPRKTIWYDWPPCLTILQ